MHLTGPPTPPRPSRRWLVGAALTVGLGLAGCTADGSGSDDADDDPSARPPSPGESTDTSDSPTTSGSAGQSQEGAVRVLTDLAYAEPVGRAHLLDLYLPEGSGPFPVVLFQAGSAFGSDDTKSSATDLSGGTTAALLAQRWAPHGYAVAGIDVRSSAQATFPAQLHDVKAAIRYLRSRAGELGLDPTRVATMGTSSGGWGAVMAGVVTGVPELEGAELGNGDQPSTVSAVVDLFGPTDFLQMDAQRLTDGMEHDPPDSPESRLMGFPIQSDPAATARADPVSYVTGASPPLWVAHGTADTTVPHQQSELLFAAYAAAGATASLTLVSDVGHTDSYLADGAGTGGLTVQRTSGGQTSRSDGPDPTYDAVLAFLQEHLGG